MNLKQLISQSDHIPLEQKECFFIIEQYIKARKGVDVRVGISPFDVFRINHKLRLMIHMTNIAIAWFKQNIDKIN